MKGLRDFLKEFAMDDSNLRVEEEVGKIKNYLWRSSSERREIPLVYFFRVKNIYNGHYHNVVLTYKDNKWFLWCGDKELQKMGYEESYCISWKNKSTKCKHCKQVAYDLLNRIPETDKIEEELLKANGLTTDDTPKTKIVSKDVLRIGFEKKLPTLLYGRTGAGKSHSIFKLIDELREEGHDFEVFQINMSSGVEDIDLIAKILPNPKEKSWITLDGELKKAFKVASEGKQVIVFIEELTRASKSARNLLLKAIDPVSGYYTLFDFVKGETISVPTDRIWFVATANLNYSDVDDIDPALLRRFVLTKYVDYDTQVEKEMLMQILDDEELVEKTMKLAKAVRALYERGEIPQPLDTGSLKIFAELLKELKDPELVAEMTFLYRIVDVDATSSPSKEQVETIREIIKKIFE